MHISHVVRKPVFMVSNRLRHKPASETNQNLKILYRNWSYDTVLSVKNKSTDQTMQAVVRIYILKKGVQRRMVIVVNFFLIFFWNFFLLRCCYE